MLRSSAIGCALWPSGVLLVASSSTVRLERDGEENTAQEEEGEKETAEEAEEEEEAEVEQEQGEKAADEEEEEEKAQRVAKGEADD